MNTKGCRIRTSRDRIHFWLETKECRKTCVLRECFHFLKLADLIFYFPGIKAIYFGANERKYENSSVTGICHATPVEIRLKIKAIAV